MTALYLLALPLGIVVGALGSLTGLGGGFLLMPILMVLAPDQKIAGLSFISMAVVFFNSLAGTIPSAIGHRVRWKTGVAYGLASLPFVVLGSHLQALVERSAFDRLFGAFLLVSACLLVLIPMKTEDGVDADRYPARFYIGVLISMGFGLVASFFGVGGGFLFVPLFVHFLQFPVKQATATSQFILIGVSASILIEGILKAEVHFDPVLMLLLTIGVLIGAVIGSAIAGRIRGLVVMRILAILLAITSIRFLIGNIGL